MQAKYVKINDLKVIDKLYHFINDELDQVVLEIEKKIKEYLK